MTVTTIPQTSPQAAGEIQRFFEELGTTQTALLVVPFVLLLASIAVLPLARPHWWEHNRNKGLVTLLFGLPIAAFFLYKDWHTLAATALDYGAFIALLGALFVISGGIYIRGSFAGRPLVNSAFLLTGAVLANLIGTTGASMLLIRPMIRANAHRHRKVHIIVFFIFLVSNAGGLLTPLGDPPLFLGFLKGVSFAWTLRLWREWLLMTAGLLALFSLLDAYLLGRESREAKALLAHEAREPRRFGIGGGHNFLFLGAVVGLILFSGYVLHPIEGDTPLNESLGAVLSKAVQALGMAAIAYASYKVTRRAIRRQNRFTFGPIIEVAVLFAGIFAAMIPALLALEARGERLGIEHPWQYFWLTGILSSFLDNAPTYLTFTSLAKGALGLPGESLHELSIDPVGGTFLQAISVGAVFMGANTYIGNGPNFMVKAIAESAGVRMPSFFGYMGWSAVALLPLCAVITVVFFR